MFILVPQCCVPVPRLEGPRLRQLTGVASRLNLEEHGWSDGAVVHWLKHQQTDSLL
jgi:hypothetical protein